MHELYVGVDGQTVTIVTDPAGIPVHGQNNTFDYPILTSITLMCIVTAVDESPATVTSYNWRCLANNPCEFFSAGVSSQTQQNIIRNNLRAQDASTIICTATIGGTEYTSDPLILRISGKLDICNSYTMGTRDTGPRAEGVYIRQITSAHGITNIYQLMCNHVWANQHNNSSMDSLYLYRDLLDCIVGLNLMIKTFL